MRKKDILLTEGKNDLEKDLFKNFEKHKMDFLCIHGDEEPEGIYAGLVKGAEDYYHIVFDDSMKVHFISVVGKCDYYKNYFDNSKYSVVNYLIENDRDSITKRIKNEINKGLAAGEKLLKFYI